MSSARNTASGCASRVGESLRDGLAWLATHWRVDVNPQPGAPEDRGMYYVWYLLALESAMDLLGLQTVDGHRWYDEAGAALLAWQHTDGSWSTRSTHEPGAILDTCFALLFLKRANKGALAFPSLGEPVQRVAANQGR